MARASKAERDAAFTVFVQQATPSLMRTAWLLTGSSDTARELVQASLVKTYAAWHRVQPAEATA
jgi:DNA-directed RNA polymerase specialized sigma24 family protein